MKKTFVIQDIMDNTYYVGDFDNNIVWTDDIEDGRKYDSKQEAEDYISEYSALIRVGFVRICEIFYHLKP